MSSPDTVAKSNSDIPITTATNTPVQPSAHADALAVTTEDQAVVFHSQDETAPTLTTTTTTTVNSGQNKEGRKSFMLRIPEIDASLLPQYPGVLKLAVTSQDDVTKSELSISVNVAPVLTLGAALITGGVGFPQVFALATGKDADLKIALLARKTDKDQYKEEKRLMTPAPDGYTYTHLKYQIIDNLSEYEIKLGEPLAVRAAKQRYTISYACVSYYEKSEEGAAEYEKQEQKSASVVVQVKRIPGWVEGQTKHGDYDAKKPSALDTSVFTFDYDQRLDNGRGERVLPAAGPQLAVHGHTPLHLLFNDREGGTHREVGVRVVLHHADCSPAQETVYIPGPAGAHRTLKVFTKPVGSQHKICYKLKSGRFWELRFETQKNY